MPTVFLIGPYKIIINTRDHRPAHVHCVGPGVFVLIEIRNQDIIRNNDVSAKDIAKLKKFIKENQDVLMIEWRRYHEED